MTEALKIVSNDDELDAIIAWILGKLWLENRQDENFQVKLLGNGQTGSFLLPFDADIWRNFPIRHQSGSSKAPTFCHLPNGAMM
jgi:hypothetical protein